MQQLKILKNTKNFILYERHKHDNEIRHRPTHMNLDLSNLNVLESTEKKRLWFCLCIKLTRALQWGGDTTGSNRIPIPIIKSLLSLLPLSNIGNFVLIYIYSIWMQYRQLLDWTGQTYYEIGVFDSKSTDKHSYNSSKSTRIPRIIDFTRDTRTIMQFDIEQTHNSHWEECIVTAYVIFDG